MAQFITFLESIRNYIGIIFALILLPFTFTASPEKHEVKNPEDVQLTFTVLSDCHIEGNNEKTFNAFTDILSDAAATESKDAIVFLGDNTMNGQHIESIFFYGALAATRPADNILVAAGNHDYSNGEGDYNTYLNRFLGYNNALLWANIRTPYYYKVINGCYFIVLSSEDITVNTMYLSDEQLQWLGDVLNKADESGSPIFVFGHHPANYIEGNYNRLTDILNDYDNLLYFCGHTHREIDEGSFYVQDGVKTINIPRSTDYAAEGYICGSGAVVEVYEDEVVVRVRDFNDHLWVESLERSYPIAE